MSVMGFYSNCSLLNYDLPVKDVRVVHDAGHRDGGPAQKVVLRPVVEIKHLNKQTLGKE
jgi:hypothetical protein